MSKYYNGRLGCLRFIADISDDCYGCNTVDSLKDLINEIRKEAIKGINEGEDYKVL